MANVTVIVAIIGVVTLVYRSFNGGRNSENPQMFILCVDCRDRYSDEGILTESCYLIILRSLVPVGISVPNVIFLPTAIPVFFCFR